MFEDDSMIGQKLGNYEITQRLGHGGMGVVYQARHGTLNRYVAIKFLAPQFCQDREYVERFLHEARAAAQLNHPNIISVFDAGAADDVYYLIMEYVKGRDLDHLIKEGELLDEARANRLMQRVASALAYAHSEGLVHRDIKPANLILTPEGQIKIGDLGLATWSRGHNPLLAGPGEVVGTPSYISPEEICDPTKVDLRADIYSLGATFYHVVTGHPPFAGSTPDEVMTKHLTDTVAPPNTLRADLSEAFSQVLCKMMAKGVEDRFQSMDEVIAALTHIEKNHEHAEPQFNFLEAEAAAAALAQKTMATLQKRLHGRTDFPSLAGTINVMSKLASVSDTTSLDELIEAILNDFALTNKLLKLVNSVFYSAYGGKIATISRAILILGLAQVRNAAVSLMLFENLQNRLMAAEIKEASISNFLSGVIARNLALKVGLANKEEAFICAVFHNLGKLLVTFYLPEENGIIQDLMVREQRDEPTASQMVLGLSPEEVGIRIANEWNFPEQIIFTMQSLPATEVPPGEAPLDQLHRVVCFANELSAVLRNAALTPEDRDAVFQNLISRFERCFSISIEEIAEILETSLNELAQYAEALNMTMEVSQFSGQ